MSFIYTHNIVKVVNIVIYLKRLYCCANGNCDEVFHYCTESDKVQKENMLQVCCRSLRRNINLEGLCICVSLLI